MQPKLGHDAASNTGSKLLAEEAKSKVEGVARPEAGQELRYQQEQKRQQAQAYVGQPVQGTQLPCVPSLTSEMLTTLPAAAFPDFDSQEVWAQFNSSFPTKSFPPGPFDQQAGANAEKAFGLNNKLSSSSAAAIDQTALPESKVNVSQLASILSFSPSKSQHIPKPGQYRGTARYGTARHGKPHLL